MGWTPAAGAALLSVQHECTGYAGGSWVVPRDIKLATNQRQWRGTAGWSNLRGLVEYKSSLGLAADSLCTPNLARATRTSQGSHAWKLWRQARANGPHHEQSWPLPSTTQSND